MSVPKITDDQDLAYERAVVAARADPALRPAILSAFLDKDPQEALERFRASEHWHRVRELLALQGVPRGARVLDFGGGRGLLGAALGLEGYRVTVCEPNPSSVCGNDAARHLRDLTGQDYSVVATLEELEGEHFDAAVCRAVLHHLEPLVGVLADLGRRIEPGGTLICSDEPIIRRRRDLPAALDQNVFVQFGVKENALLPDDYRDALASAGYTQVKVRFPVTWSGYRRFTRPHTPVGLALPLYWRYRLRSTFRPEPGAIRAIVARRPMIDVSTRRRDA